MSLQLIQQYQSKVEKIVQYGGSRNESSIRSAFQSLLDHYCAGKALELIAELEFKTRYGTTVYPDGTLKDALRQDWGYWESKDEFDNLDEEIARKLAKGYPTSNILLEDGKSAVLLQDGNEVGRVAFQNAPALEWVLDRYKEKKPRDPTIRARFSRYRLADYKEQLIDLLQRVCTVSLETMKIVGEMKSID